MRATNVKSLCRLSALFRSALKPNTLEFESSSLGPPILEDDSSVHKCEPTLSALKYSGAENSPNQVSMQISSILCNGRGVKRPDGDIEKLERAIDIPWFSRTFHGNIAQRHKEVSRERKQKWITKSSHGIRFERVVKMCAEKLGTEATIEVFDKLGKETGIKEYNALLGICVNKAREAVDEEVAIQEMGKAFYIFRVMREQGYQLQEQTYRPLLVYLIDMGMVEEFQFFSDVIKDKNPSSVSRLHYYEMMLWLRVNNEEKIRDLFNYIVVNDGEHTSNLRESYLLAFCESDRKEELLQLLEIIDMTKLSSTESVENVFKSLGRLLLESVAEKFLLAFKTCDHEADNITNFIASYAVSIPNLVVDDVILRFKDLHHKLKVSPSSSSYEKLISYSCDLHEVHIALNIVDEMCEAGLTLSTELLNSILCICEETCEYNLVHRIYFMIWNYNLKSNVDTFWCMINLCVRMKDFESAYKMLDDLEQINLKPTTNMYNAIMAGYFREKNISGALRVLKQMEGANVKPDSHTFSYLISNSKTAEDIAKYYEELKESGNQATKQVFIALINAYVACGRLEKAKQVVSDPNIPPKSLNEIKSVLVSALASHGQLSESSLIHEEIKNAGHNLEPKAVINLIEEHAQYAELDRSLLLLKELSDPDYWIDGCFRIITYCVRNKSLSSAVDLIKQLKDKFHSDELLMETLLDQVFSVSASESTYLEFGLDLFWVIRKELGVLPSRQCLDFLLSACANAKDLRSARLIWKEYKVVGYPYNVLSSLRMYQALMASGDHRSANFVFEKISKDDPHVCAVIKACQRTYHDLASVEITKKKKTKKKEKKLK